MPAVRGEVAAGPRNEEYEPATDRWRERAPVPQARDHLGVAAHNGKIYTFGGFTSSVHQGAGDVAFAYDPANDRWQTLAPMKAPRAAVGVTVRAGKIHVIGGRGLDGVTVATHEVYDPASGRWSEAAPLPKARDHMAVVAAEGKIYGIGGRLAGAAERTGQHDVYDPTTNAWTSAPPLPTPRSGVAAALYKGMILVLVGELPPNHTFVENEAYDPTRGHWGRARAHAGGAALGAMPVVAGGLVSSRAVRVLSPPAKIRVLSPPAKISAKMMTMKTTPAIHP